MQRRTFLQAVAAAGACLLLPIRATRARPLPANATRFRVPCKTKLKSWRTPITLAYRVNAESIRGFPPYTLEITGVEGSARRNKLNIWITFDVLSRPVRASTYSRKDLGLFALNWSRAEALEIKEGKT